MSKKIFSVLLALIMVVSLLAACGQDTEPEVTEAPAATEAATEAPTEAPTEEPTAEATEPSEPTEAATEAPTVEVLNVDSVMTDMSTDVDLDAFIKLSGATFDLGVNTAYVSGTSSGSAVSLRLYDMRLIDAVLEENSSADRTLADATQYPFYAIKYRIDEDVELSDYDFTTTTDATNLTQSPDVVPYDNKPFIQDGQWHIHIFDIKEEFPNCYALSEQGDPFDCLAIPATTDSDMEYEIAWYGLFKSVDDINAWDENYTARFANDLK